MDALVDHSLVIQDRCVDLATEVFVLKNKVDEQAKELKWAKREAEAREKDFKVCRRFSWSSTRAVTGQSFPFPACFKKSLRFFGWLVGWLGSLSHIT